MSELALRLWACDCAERTLPYWEREYPDDHRPREAIEVARRYARGDATSEERYHAAESAKAAGRNAEYSAGYVNDPAARIAAETAARTAAWSAETAADTAAWSARTAAWSAYGSDANAAAKFAAWSAAETVAEAAARTAKYAARNAESRWQIERLRQYLAGEVQS